MNNVIAIVAVVFAGALFFQGTPDIPVYTIGSGGGTSTGGGYSLSGTVGQSSASTSSAVGGGYSLNGGFWPQVYAVGVDLTIVAVMPSAPGTDPNSDLTITFNLPVVKGTGNIVISSGGQTIETIAVSSNQVMINNNVVTIDPATLLNLGATYTITVPAGAFQDGSGAPSPGLGG